MFLNVPATFEAIIVRGHERGSYNVNNSSSIHIRSQNLILISSTKPSKSQINGSDDLFGNLSQTDPAARSNSGLCVSLVKLGPVCVSQINHKHRYRAPRSRVLDSAYTVAVWEWEWFTSNANCWEQTKSGELLVPQASARWSLFEYMGYRTTRQVCVARTFMCIVWRPSMSDTRCT